MLEEREASDIASPAVFTASNDLLLRPVLGEVEIMLRKMDTGATPVLAPVSEGQDRSIAFP